MKVNWNDENLATLFRMRKDHSVKEIAAHFGVTPGRISQIVAKYKNTSNVVDLQTRRTSSC